MSPPRRIVGHRLIRIVGCLLLAALALAADAMALSPEERAWVAQHPVVRIQMSDSSPPFEFREGGRWQGLAYDCLVAACERIGLRIEVTGMAWERSLEAIGGGDGVDLLLAVTRSPERERQMLLTAPYLAFPQVIIADHQRRFVSGLADLRHATIAVEREYVMESWLRRDLPEARLVTTDGSPPALQAVSSGQADAYVGNLAVASYLIERHGLVNIGIAAPSGYGDEEFTMGVRRDWPELVRLLDRAVAEMPHEQRQALRERWLAVRYDHGLRYADIALWVLVVTGVALVFIVQLRRMVNARTRELAREVELRRDREAHLAEAQRIAHLGSWTWDAASDTLAWSEETRRIFAWPEAREVTVAGFIDAVHAEDRDGIRRHYAEAQAGRCPGDLDYRIVRPDGEVRHLLQRCRAVAGASGRLERIQGVVLDISERKRAEDERARLEHSLRHAEKLRVIGQLAGGIAHDFNNLLAGISGNAELLLRHLAEDGVPGGERLRRHAEGVLTSAERAAAITAQLRVFSRRDGFDRAPTDVHALIRETIELIRHGSGVAIDIRLDLAAAHSVVDGDAALIQTALANLAINARDAMPGGGTLTVTTSEVRLDGEVPGGHAFGIVPGPHLVIALGDTGSGMDEAVRARLFEPFFTTKAPGKGTGLGLANVHACIRNHRGAIAVDSTPGRGSTFRVYLPLSATAASSAAGSSSGLVSGRGSILVVDDDPTLRGVATEMLDILGYSVSAVAGGQEAEALFRASHGQIDLVMLDMVMPGMDGSELIARLRRIDPGVRILLCSGAFQDGPAHLVPGADGFLQKPYAFARLSQVVAATIRLRA